MATMTTKQIERLVRLVTENHINAYSENSAKNKDEFIKLCKAYLNMIVKKLGLTKDQYEIRVNRSGIAGSGDITLHTDTLYVQLSQSCCDRHSFMYRSCRGQKDYTGGRNEWMRWTNLLDIPDVVGKFKKTAMLMEQLSMMRII